jgi:competence protein ComEC
MLDVGQGDAIFVEFPSGKTLLVDAGPKIWHYDAGEKIVSRFLKRRGFASLDAVLISHPHMDHFGGLQSVFLNLKVGQIIEGLAPPDTGVYFEYMKAASERGTILFQTGLGKFLTMDEDVRIYVVHPLEREDVASNENNSSVVFKLEYGNTSILFTGDAETEAETKLAKRYGSFLRSQILKAGHHGSSTSSSDLFVRTVRPRAALVSVGLNNKFRHPSPEVMGRMKQDGIDVARTDEEGAIVFQSNGKKWERVQWRN